MASTIPSIRGSAATATTAFGGSLVRRLDSGAGNISCSGIDVNHPPRPEARNEGQASHVAGWEKDTGLTDEFLEWARTEEPGEIAELIRGAVVSRPAL
jgi:hypothetical protein